MRILLIDDDHCEHRLVDCYLVAKFGADYDLVATACLDEALDHLARERFDAILLDDQLRPFGDARRNVPLIREACGTTPIVLISVSDLSGRAVELRDHDITDTVDKFELKTHIMGGLLGSHTMDAGGSGIAR